MTLLSKEGAPFGHAPAIISRRHRRCPEAQEMGDPRFWFVFGIGLFGILAATPYPLMRAFASGKRGRIPLPLLLLLQVLFNAALLWIATWAGLYFADRAGLGTPLIGAWLSGEGGAAVGLGDILGPTIGLGAAVGLILLLLGRLTVPKLLSAMWASAPWWQRCLLAFYGGITEEILLRLFLFSAVAWLFGKTSLARSPAGLLWLTNVLVALAFGALHLPTLSALGLLRFGCAVAALFLNGIAGIAFGYLYWTRGLEAAMTAHLTADLCLHGIGSLLPSRALGTSTPPAGGDGISVA